MNKKGIQLSVNFLVVIILGLVILGLGMSLFYKLIGSATTTVQEVDRQTQERLERMMVGGNLVVVSDTTKAVETGEYADFFVGITNELADTTEFDLHIEYLNSQSGQNNPMMSDEDVIFNPGPYLIDVNGFEFIPVRIVVPKNTPRDSYLFLVTVAKDGLPLSNPDAVYGSKHLLTVNVNK
ncbi:hypothetical protein CMO92_02980 [Candidatus Woesearchaeota archaeon]|nr:hypothetical protein [Candidatus Woesearchaeota archaeon]